VLPDDLPPFALLSIGKARKATNVLRGSVGGNSVVVFDYTFYNQITGRPTEFPTFYYDRHFAGATIACVKSSWLSLPEFVMEPSFVEAFKKAEVEIAQQLGEGRVSTMVQGLMHAAEGLIIDAPGWHYPERPDFTYRVRAPDERAARALFTPAVIDYFAQRKDWVVEGRGDWLLVTFPQRMKPRDRASHDEGRLPADRLPELVNAATATLDVLRRQTS